MNVKIFIFIFLASILFCASLFAAEDNVLRVFTWSGYVEPDEVKTINKILREKGYDIEVEVIKPWAEGPEQMFDVFRRTKQVDISFLTLNYIGMQGGKQAALLQPINSESPRIPNYKKLLKNLTNIPMGMKDGKPLYIPWGGGAYGIWANMNKLKEDDLPKSVNDLWAPKWKGKMSLTDSQIQPNIAIVSMALGKPPFFINEAGRDELTEIRAENGEFQKKTNALYAQVASFWGGSPEFKKDYLLVSCYGVEIAEENRKGGNWKLVKFKEGNTVWMDTINFNRELKGKKLEAAEIFANYWIGEEVQKRVVEGLSMVSVSTITKHNPLLQSDPNFFRPNFFWPPYNKQSDNTMLLLNSRALKAAGKK